MKLLSSKEAANYLHISVKALQALRERGQSRLLNSDQGFCIERKHWTNWQRSTKTPGRI